MFLHLYWWDKNIRMFFQPRIKHCTRFFRATNNRKILNAFCCFDHCRITFLTFSCCHFWCEAWKNMRTFTFSSIDFPSFFFWILLKLTKLYNSYYILYHLHIYLYSFVQKFCLTIIIFKFLFKDRPLKFQLSTFIFPFKFIVISQCSFIYFHFFLPSFEFKHLFFSDEELNWISVDSTFPQHF